MIENKWTVKNNLEGVMNHICYLVSTDLQKHYQLMVKNAAYMSNFTVKEMMKI